MRQIDLQVPDTLHLQLETLARSEGVSLQQYLLYMLARLAAQGYRVAVVPAEEQRRQHELFAALRQQLGQASDDEVARVLAERTPVAPEPELTPKVIAHLKAQMQHECPRQ